MAHLLTATSSRLLKQEKHTLRTSWTSRNRLAFQQHISIWSSPRMTRSSSVGACLDRTRYTTRLEYETNTLFSSFTSYSFFCLHFCGHSPKKLILYKCLNWECIIFWVSLISSMYEVMRLAYGRQMCTCKIKDRHCRFVPRNCCEFVDRRRACLRSWCFCMTCAMDQKIVYIYFGDTKSLCFT